MANRCRTCDVHLVVRRRRTISRQRGDLGVGRRPRRPTSELRRRTRTRRRRGAVRAEDLEATWPTPDRTRVLDRRSATGAGAPLAWVDAGGLFDRGGLRHSVRGWRRHAAARYARSQAVLEQAGAASDREWAGREFGSMSRIVGAPDGRRYRIRRVAPGDSVDHAFAAGLAGFASAVLTRGAPMFESSNVRWVVVIDRVRGPLRRDERLRRWVVADGTSAKRLHADLDSFVSAGGSVEMFDA
jgi:hypothetical protein